MNANPIHILLVEDNPDHIFLARKAIHQEMGSRAHVSHVMTGEEAIDFLQRRGPHVASPRPDLILLDLQLPGRDGFWVVRTIKNDENLQSIPVVIFTSSDADTDIQLGYQCGTNIYVCKPTGPDEFAARLRAIPAFWSRVAHLPPRPDRVADQDPEPGEAGNGGA